MHFISLNYLALVCGLLAVYYLPGIRKFQVYLLIVGSLFFYGYGQIYLLPLLIFTAVTAGILAWILLKDHSRKILVYVGVILFLFVLAFFKYKFIPAFNVQALADSTTGPAAFLLLLPLPIGISFYTFQAISLVVDSYKKEYEGKISPSGNWYSFLKNSFFYIVFFPQLVAGPIVKAHDFLPQIKEKSFKDVDLEDATKNIILGLFFKSVIADNLNTYTSFMQQIAVNKEGTTIEALLLLVGYSAQIYADFFGYTLLAIGVAALFGYKLPENFNVPYISQSIAEFWRRWHISLSSFLREYLYIPLGGNRKGEVRTYANLIIVMGLGGLWHGAALSYLFWGLYHGVGLAIERPFVKTAFFTSKNPILSFSRTILIFAFVSFGWIFFRFPDANDVKNYLGTLISGSETSILSGTDIGVVLMLCLPVLFQHVFVKFNGKLGTILTTVLYGSMLGLFFLQRGATDAFIYFQF